MQGFDPGRRYGLRVTITEVRPVRQRSGVAARLVALSSLLIGLAIAAVMLWKAFSYPSIEPFGPVYSEKLIGPELVLVGTGDVDDGLAIFATSPDKHPDCEVSTIGPVPMTRPARSEVARDGSDWYPVLRSAEPVSLPGYTVVCKNDGAQYAVGPRDWPSVPQWVWFTTAIADGVVATGVAATALALSARRTPA